GGILRAQAGPVRRPWRRYLAGAGACGARARLRDERAEIEGRPDPDQRRRPGTVRSEIPSVFRARRTTGRIHHDASERIHAWRASYPFLFQQRARQSARHIARAAQPDLLWNAGALSRSEVDGGAWRRLSAGLLRAHRSCLGRTKRLARRAAAAADDLSAAS